MAVEYKKLIRKTIDLSADGDTEAMSDCLYLIRSLELENSTEVLAQRLNDYGTVIYDPKNFEMAHKYIKELRAAAAKETKNGNSFAADIYRQCLLFDAPHFLDEAILYAEFDRAYEKKFYEPRRKQLKQVVDAMQKLEERKIHTLGVMMPPGVGKSSIEIMFMVWSGFRNSGKGILMGSHSNSLLNGVYNEIMRMLDKDGEYRWREIFPNVKFAGNNAKEMRIDLGSRKRFETFQFASVGAGNAGRVRASNLLVLDDLVDGIESAMSKDRMDKLWQQFNTDYLQRRMDDCGLLLVATPWSLHDPIDKLEQMNDGNPDAQFIHLPAMDENDESNFQYPCGVGFSTEFYREQREIMDDVSWRALYMTQPIEREGTLYASEELRRFFELPDREPDAILAVADTKNKGDDYFVVPVAYQYGEDFYIGSFICDNGKPEIVDDRVANILVSKNVEIAQFESNNAGGRIAGKIQDKIKEMGGRCKITTKWVQSNKETRIIIASAWVKEHCLFLDDSVADREYKRAIQFLTSYTMVGKNKHDDVPDAMAAFYDFVTSGLNVSKIEVRKRFF